jgi:hypothetical protein
MLRLKFRTLASPIAVTMALCGLLGRDQSQTEGSLFGPVSLGPVWKGAPLAGLLGWPVTGMPGVRYHGLFAGLGLGFGELPNVPQ